MQSDHENSRLEELPEEYIGDESVNEEVASSEQQAIDSDSHSGTTHVSWQALENIPVQRSAAWYAGLAAVTAVFMAVAVFLMKSWSFPFVIAAAAVALVVYTKRPPRTVNYTLSPKGIYVDDELSSIDNYKAFGVRREGDLFVLIMLPIKRFMPGLSAYFPEPVGEDIVDILAPRLPMQEIQPDIVDNIVKKLRL